MIEILLSKLGGLFKASNVPLLLMTFRLSGRMPIHNETYLRDETPGDNFPYVVMSRHPNIG